MPSRFERVILYIILLIGVILSVIQFFYNRSLCGDEVWLVLNIVDRNFFELLKPLDYVQSAPILFLEIEKLCSVMIPGSELGLKIFPLICYLLSLWLFFKILRIVHSNQYTIIFSLSLFVFNIFLIRYSNEVKQYMTDVLVVIYFYYLLLRTYKKPHHKYYYLAIIGVISIFLSNVAVTILFTVGLYLLHTCYRYDKKQFRPLVIVSFIWVLSLVAYYVLFVRDNPVKDLMVGMWSEAFMPLNPLTKEFYTFILQQCSMLLLNFFQYGNLGEVLIILVVLGVFSLIQKRRVDLLILTLVPIFFQFLLSGLKIYPVLARTLLFLCPIIIVICSFGFNLIITRLFDYFKMRRLTVLAVFIPAMMIGYFFFLVKVGSYPFKRSEIKNSITYIEDNIQVHDKVYVTYFASWAYRYYGKIAFRKIDNETTTGTMRYKNDAAAYYHELDSLNGRVWFLFTDIGDDKHENREMVINYLDSKNRRMVNTFHASECDVYLYDLGN
jgi:hypothetical protein